MIEIVRDAVTIAAIQKSQGGGNGDEALFEWLKSKCPLQEIVSKMEAPKDLQRHESGLHRE